MRELRLLVDANSHLQKSTPLFRYSGALSFVHTVIDMLFVFVCVCISFN